MDERTIYVRMVNGSTRAIGLAIRPTKSDYENALDWNTFVRADTRIYVLVFSGTLAVSEQRQLAVNYYENRQVRHNFSDISTKRQTAIPRRKTRTP